MPRRPPGEASLARPGEMINLLETHTGTSELGSVVDFRALELGALVKLKGGLKTFRGELQLTLEKMGKPG